MHIHNDQKFILNTTHDKLMIKLQILNQRGNKALMVWY